MKQKDLNILNQIARRAHLIVHQMIHLANYRSNQEKGDPKVGGHSSASASALHILGALHLVVKSGYDHVVNKPHASPADHGYNYLLNLFLDDQFQSLSLESAKQALKNFRAFPQNNEYAFQSYHSVYDPDHYNFLPSGTVGIPPVVLGYLALAYRMVEIQGYKTPPAHFWAVIGDSEFREGSLMEAIPDLAEREVGNLTWIIDYNRQSLDGHRFVNEKLMEGSDADRIEKTLLANGWNVIQLQHGSLRKKLFQQAGGKNFQVFLENQLQDIELQSCLLKTPKELRSFLSRYKKLEVFLKNVNDSNLKSAFEDLGGHDFSSLISSMESSKKDPQKPSCIIAHTVKGWGLEMAAKSSNHSSLVSKTELAELRKGLNGDSEFPLFLKGSDEEHFLRKRRESLYSAILKQNEIKKQNRIKFESSLSRPDFPKSFSVNFQQMSYPHTQWFLGQITAKLARISNTSEDSLVDKEKVFKSPAQLVFTMSPDVGTSTNLGSAMNNKVFGPVLISDKETLSDLEDPKSPNLSGEQQKENRFIRFEIAEANSISCMAAFGKMRDTLGVPVLPVVTMYDFFLKRALDQLFYAFYWNSSFILCGTPSGVTLSPEGAQHCWKSDLQIPNQITWEPFFLQEMDWIMADSLKRHFENDNKNRSGVLIRAVTRGVDQKQFMDCLRTQKRFKTRSEVLLLPKGVELLSHSSDESQESCVSDPEIQVQIQREVLSGAYYLLNYTGYADYKEEENVVHLFSMGSPSVSAIEASKELLKQGVYVNVIIVTSPDLLLGNLAYQNNYFHLKERLLLADTRAPVVSVHDGEPGLLDNIGSILGIHHECLAVRKHSLCGRPRDVYQFHGIDKDSIIKACLKVLDANAKIYMNNISV